ncbi:MULTISPECIES: ANTAR domain-containing response regulator [unclassified Butyrivibrio]|uniref:ANTAR domain-containing response regulator n=1 Tax=unclassified Butyrivibrio TaxID=2639466 RepID=UPI0003B71E79|nr:MULTISPECIES: ANTAR domain-containing protein [unclassified Butyrivibrio]MDC7293554.1 ANTAR domain-containing protein [Butyrivibrio sp. DSM 10294]
MNIIVAFAKQADVMNFKSILSRGGYDSVKTCTSGVQALSAMEDLGSGVIICGYRLSDMLYSELAEDLPGYFQMLMIAGPDKAPDFTSDNLVYLPTPIKKSDLFSTLELMLEGVARKRKKAKEKRLARSDEDKKTIAAAKEILMDRHHMTEPEAHKYLQKCAMDSGTNMLETAEMIISLRNI